MCGTYEGTTPIATITPEIVIVVENGLIQYVASKNIRVLHRVIDLDMKKSRDTDYQRDMFVDETYTDAEKYTDDIIRLSEE